MKATLLAGLCLVLMGIIVGLAAPKGALISPFEGLLGGAASEASPSPVAVVQAEPAAPEARLVAAAASEVGPEAEAPVDANAADAAYLAAEMGATPGPKPAEDECSKLTEAARSGYMSAGYATQEFALASIKAKTDKASQSALLNARNEYQAALRDAHARIADASHARCWSRTGTTPPDVEAFETSLPSAAKVALAH